jgi:phospholipid-binding lipoprotein MlaA
MQICRMSLIVSGLFAAGLAISGCAAPPAPGAAAAANAVDFNDPYEDTNRQIFGFNQSVDKNVLVPVANTYRNVVPPPMRQSLHEFLLNLNGPVIFANDVLQGDPNLASKTLARLALNTTVGVGGLFDVATRMGIPYHTNDFGITLAHWGFVSGPYIIVPVLGPSNPRDLVGQGVDSFMDPADYVASQHRVWAAVVARTVVSGVDERSRNIETLAEIEKTALDYYATIRSLYRQRREAQIRHEQSNLPNPGFGGGDDSGAASMSYTISR